MRALLAYVRREARIIRDECAADGVDASMRACVAMVVRELRDTEVPCAF